MKKLDLDKILQSPNIAEDLEPEVLAEISSQVLSDFDTDKSSMQDWLKEVDEAVDLAKLKRTHKNYPWADASNVKFPMVATAAFQFNARSYPEIVRAGRVVECRTFGKDDNGEKALRSTRVANFMNYQLLCSMDRWEQDTDRLLYMLAIVGTIFRKTYFDPTQGKIISEVCLPHEVIVNNNITCLEEADRISHVLNLSKNTILANIRAGLFSDIFNDVQFDNLDLKTSEFVEQHCLFDLDGDGYREPYIVVIHKASGKIARMAARFDMSGVKYSTDDEIINIKPVQYFTDYRFLPAADGSFYAMGFGILLLSLNDTVNSLLNQLIDAGSLATLQGGFLGSGLRLKGGNISLRPGEWKVIDVIGNTARENIVPVSYKEPSPVLFQLLGFLIEHTNKLTSITDILSGNERTQNSPATTILTLVEQGLKVFSSIMRRQYWSFKSEFEKIFRLNRLFLDPAEYENVLDEPISVQRDESGAPVIMDFEERSYDVRPVSDPNGSSTAQQVQQIQLLMQLVSMPEFKAELNSKEILNRILLNSNQPNVEALANNDPPTPSLDEKQMQVDAIMKKHDMDMADREQRVKEGKLPQEQALIEAQIEESKSRAILNVAQAESAQTKSTLDQLKLLVESLVKDHEANSAHLDRKLKAIEVGLKDDRERKAASATGMGTAPNNEEIA